MALIKCPECGKEISSKAEICIGCGYPIKKILSEKTELAEDILLSEEAFLPAKEVSRIVTEVKRMRKTISLDKFFDLLFECAINEAKL